jgi:hypothetical protein
MFALNWLTGFRGEFFLNIFPIGSYVKIKSSHGGHLEFPISKRFTSFSETDLNQTWQKCSLDGHIQDFVFGTDRKSNMAARAHNVF